MDLCVQAALSRPHAKTLEQSTPNRVPPATMNSLRDVDSAYTISVIFYHWGNLGILALGAPRDGAGGETVMNKLALACAAFCLVGVVSTASAQVRSIDDQFTEIDLLFNILTATVNGINVDDPATLQANFEGLEFSDFDRDRSGEFMTFGAALGLFDLTLAIMQFNHDPVDADGDGLIGFYELECEYAGGGVTLSPTAAETSEGVPDGSTDCDGDGSANLVEVNAGTNPLDPNDFPEVDFEIVDPGIEEQPLSATSGEDGFTLTLKPNRKHVFQGGGLTLEAQFTQ